MISSMPYSFVITHLMTCSASSMPLGEFQGGQLDDFN